MDERRSPLLRADDSPDRSEAATAAKPRESGHVADPNRERALGRFPYSAHGEALARGHAVPVGDFNAYHRRWPERWQHFIRTNFRSQAHVCHVFPVSPRTAAKWWRGETAGSAPMLAMALVTYGPDARRMLIDGDSEPPAEGKS
ncbi:MAG: hypothetical protein AAF647_02170 [Pseudomonadota bacterium]